MVSGHCQVDAIVFDKTKRTLKAYEIKANGRGGAEAGGGLVLRCLNHG